MTHSNNTQSHHNTSKDKNNTSKHNNKYLIAYKYKWY